MEVFGNWTGCHFKYSNFIPKYLGLKRPAIRHPVVETLPIKVKEFVECLNLDHYVQLYLFLKENEEPVAQFIDGLRGVWEFPHSCKITVNPKNVEGYLCTQNAFIENEKGIGESRVLENSIVVDVGDGCRPAFTTIVGKNISYKDFKDKLVSAEIFHFNPKRGVFFRYGIF